MYTTVHDLPLFHGLNGAALAAIADADRGTMQLGPGRDLELEGDRPEHVHVLLEGWAFRYALLPDGRRQISAILLPGDVADLDLLRIERLEHGVATLSPCRFAMLSRPVLIGAIEWEPALAQIFLSLALRENAVLTRHSVAVARQSAREQVAHLFCELATRLGTGDGHDGNRESRFTLPLTQADLGDLLGLSTVHVNRVLQSLRMDGLIRMAHKRLEILDWNALAALAQFRPEYLQIGRPDIGQSRPERHRQDNSQRSSDTPVSAA